MLASYNKALLVVMHYSCFIRPYMHIHVMRVIMIPVRNINQQCTITYLYLMGNTDDFKI